MSTASSAQEYIERLAAAPTLEGLPPVTDPVTSPPSNPPRAVQERFVGSSYADAYSEAERFVGRAFEFLPAESVAELRVLDFGAGWGRILRMLLLRLKPEQLWSTDVDLAMTALIQGTLPGVNANTNAPLPPSSFRSELFDAITAFSVFSHLSEDAHRAWVAEFARVLRPGGRVFVTVLEAQFLATVAGAQAAVQAGEADPFATKLAGITQDAESDLRAAADGGFVYAGLGDDDGPRARSFYSWAVAPRTWLEQVWGEAGFELTSWTPTGELFEQAMAVFTLTDPSKAGEAPASTPAEHPARRRWLRRR
jgi:2-polyprenyl-3-methyl-5-hydroxy-6-metoxy-1,4-benzoquinol methylase